MSTEPGMEKGSERVPLRKEPSHTSTPNLLPPKDGVLLVQVRTGSKGDKAGRGGGEIRKRL